LRNLRVLNKLERKALMDAWSSPFVEDEDLGPAVVYPYGNELLIGRELTANKEHTFQVAAGRLGHALLTIEEAEELY
jgi:hypothetical protein